MNMHPVVGQGIGPMRIVYPGKEQVISTRPCERCGGHGYINHDQWVTIKIEGQEPYPANFGHVSPCWACDRTGNIVTAIYTRGVSLTPLVNTP